MLLIDTRKGQFSPERAVVGDIPIDSPWIETQLAILVSEDQLAAVVKDLGLHEFSEFNTSLMQRARSFLARIEDRGFGFSISRASDGVRCHRARHWSAAATSPGKRKDLSWIIEITARSSSADLAARIANAVTDAYIRAQRERKVEATRDASEWLRTRLEALRDQSSAAESAVVEFKAKHNIIAFNGKLMSEQQIAELNTQLAAVRAEASSAQARLTGSRKSCALRRQPRSRIR